MSKKTGKIIQIICFAVFFACGAYLGKYFYDSREAQKNLSEIQQVVEEAQTAGEETRAENGMLIGYSELYKQNSDMVGWIRIENTEINYPVMQTADGNEFYLKKGFEKDFQSGGLPFADFQCNVTKPSDNVIIYGHNMRNGSMFASLLDYNDKEFLNTHRTIEFDTLYEHGRYEILYVIRTKVGSKNEFKYHEFIDAGNQEDFEEFITKAKELSLTGGDESVAYGDKLLTLSTCSYNVSNERFVVIAKRIR